jgi:hypothetical protein
LRVDLARGLVDVLLFLCAFGALVATVAGASTASAIETGAAEDGPTASVAIGAISVAIGAISAGPTTATGTTGTTSETDGSDCTSGAEVSTTGVSTAVICGTGAACTAIAADPKEPSPEGPAEMDVPLCLGFTAYKTTAAPTPTAKMMVSTCPNTIFYTPVSFVALSCLLMTSQRYYTIASIQRTGARKSRRTLANNFYIIFLPILSLRLYYDVSTGQIMSSDLQV